MKIKIKNFGAIQTGEISLSNKVTLFCGPNCTGKTYMAYLLYALLSSDNRLYIVDTEMSVDDIYAHKQIIHKISKKFLEAARKRLLQRIKLNMDTLLGLSEDAASSLFEDLELSFAVSTKKLYENIISVPIQTIISIGEINFALSKTKDSDLVRINVVGDKTVIDIPKTALQYYLTSKIYNQLLKYPIGEVAIFPVERNSVYTFSKELSIRKQEKWDQMQMIFDKGRKISDVELIVSSSKRYPLPIRDNLVIADDIVEIKKNKSEFYDFAENIERSLLQGKVVISNDGEILFQPSHDAKTTMPIQITASIVKSMSSLIVYLKHIAKKNDLIIIDEPEINLHPENQIVLARIFANLANVGFRLLISTHSDYIVREINNMIMGYEQPKIAKKIGYSPQDLLDKNDVSVYYFSLFKDTGKSIVNPIEIEDYGFEIPSIDKTIVAQNDILELLSYEISKKMSNGTERLSTASK